jgi:hypothetical protein
MPTPATIPPPVPPADPPAMSPLKKWAMGCFLALLVAFTTVCIVVAVMWRQFHREPEFWDKQQALLGSQDPKELAQSAEDFERKILNSTAAPGESEPVEPERTIHITCDEVNAWIAVKAKAWAAHQNIQLPAEVQGTMITIEDGHLVIAFRLETPKVQKVVSAPMEVRVLENGFAEVKLLGLRAGDMNVPLWAIPASLAQGGGRDESAWLEQAQAGIQFLPVRAIDPYRSLRLTAIAVTADGLDLTVKTEGQARRKK